MIELRDYQKKIIDTARAEMLDGLKDFLICSPVGSGKTLLCASMLKAASMKGLNAIFCVHRRELVKQSMKTFSAVGLNFGVCAAGFIEEPRFQVQIASIQTLARRYKKLKKPKLIIFDEAHHQAAKSWADVFHSFPDSYRIGLSATPERLDGKGLGEFFKKIIFGPSMNELIAQGYLSPFKIYAPAQVNTGELHTVAGDFNKSELGALMDKPTIVGQAVDHYKKYADGKRALVRGVSIQHSQHIAAQFNAAGIAAEHVDGETPTEVRDAAMRSFETGKILVLSFVDLFSEGLDVPGIEAILDFRPTASLTLWLQFCGRSLRPAPGKVAIILDAAGNALRHGLPDDEREWSLAGRNIKRRGTDESDVSVKVCPKCLAAMKPMPACQYCGYVFELKPREVKQVDGELVEIQRRQARQQQGRTETLAELAALGAKRGYKRPWAWAHFVFQGRQKKKLAGVK